MDHPKSGSQSQRRRGRGRNTASAQSGSSAPNKFSKGPSMKSFKSMMDSGRQHARRTQDEEYFGPPPADASLIQARLVLPGKHLLPRGLDQPGALNDVRRTYQVYITHDKPNVLDIRCDSITRLQKAVQAVNWAIYDLRLSNDHPAVRFLLQEPTNAAPEGKIKTELGKRPQYLVKSSTATSNASAMDVHVPRLAADLVIAAETLTTIQKHLKMRVIFGQLVLRQKKKGSEEEIGKDDFVKLLDMHSYRGGANLETRIPDVRLAEEVTRLLSVPAAFGNCDSGSRVDTRTDITFVVPGKEIVADIRTSMERPQLSAPRTGVPEAWGRLNWTVAAPDMKYDWSFRVDATNEATALPPGFSNLPQKLTLAAPRVRADDPGIFSFPRIIARLGDLESQVSQIRMTTVATIPYKTTPYAVEVNVSKVWEGGRTSAEPTITWGMELFASNWDETVNYVGTGGRKKDWGQGLQHIWPGDDPKLEARFGDFLRTVLEVQALLEDIDSNINFEQQP